MPTPRVILYCAQSQITVLARSILLLLFVCPAMAVAYDSKTAENNTTKTISTTNTSVAQTKNQLKQLDNKIYKLKQTLANAHNKRVLINQELARNEKQMGDGIQRLHNIQKDMDVKQQQIISLKRYVSKLNKQLISQQQLLAEHARICYKMGENQPIKLLLNQETLNSISRLLTFHQYLIRSRQKVISEIEATTQNLSIIQNNLNHEIENQQTLQKQLNTQQEQLNLDKDYQTTIIQSLTNDIQSKQHILVEFEHNKASLSSLLKSLSIQSHADSSPASDSRQPIISMHHKLTNPVLNVRGSLQAINQGITFFTKEGTPIYAVYSGKIVFSDWLNGYGLLLIIDHGQGFMTLYAHNQSLFKHKGTTVLQGEQIATVGHSGGVKQNGLYFEVRLHGKAVNPTDWLV